MESLSRIGIEATGGDTFQAVAGAMDRAADSATRLEGIVTSLAAALGNLGRTGAGGMFAEIERSQAILPQLQQRVDALARAWDQVALAAQRATVQPGAIGTPTLQPTATATAAPTPAPAPQTARATQDAASSSLAADVRVLETLATTTERATTGMVGLQDATAALARLLPSLSASGLTAILAQVERASEAVVPLEERIAALDAGLAALGKGGAGELAVQLQRAGATLPQVVDRVQALAQAWQQVELAARDAADASKAAVPPPAAPAAPARVATPSPAAASAATSAVETVGGGGSPGTLSSEQLDVVQERAITNLQAFERGLLALAPPATAAAAAFAGLSEAVAAFDQELTGSGGKATDVAIALTQLARAQGQIREDTVQAAQAATQASRQEEEAVQAQARAIDALANTAARFDAGQAQSEARMRTMRTTDDARTQGLRQIAAAYDQARDATIRADGTTADSIRINGQLKASLTEIVAEAKLAGAAMGGLSGGGGLFGANNAGARNFALVNVTEQARQFVEQVSFGTSPFQALAQQLPQATVGFGLFGAAVGLAAGALAGGYLLLQNWVGGLDQATTAAKKQKDATDALASALHVQLGGVTELGASFGALSQTQRGVLAASLDDQLVRVRKEAIEAGKAVDDLRSKTATGAVVSSPIMQGGQFGEAPPQVDATKALTTAQDDFNAAFKEFKDNLDQPETAGATYFDQARAELAALYQELGKSPEQVSQLVAGFDNAVGKSVEMKQGLTELTAQVHLLYSVMGGTEADKAFNKFDAGLLHEKQVTAETAKLLEDAQKRDFGQTFDNIRQARDRAEAIAKTSGGDPALVEKAAVHSTFSTEDEQEQQRSQDAADRLRTSMHLTAEEASRIVGFGKNLQVGLEQIAQTSDNIKTLHIRIAQGIGDQVTNQKQLSQEEQHLHQLVTQRSDATHNALAGMAGQVDAAAKLRAELDKIASIQRQPGGADPADVAAAKQGAYARFAQGLEQQIANQNQGLTKQQIVQAQINGLVQEEGQYRAGQVTFEAEIARLKGEQSNLEAKSADTLAQYTQGLDAQLAKMRERDELLKRRSGQGEVASAVADAQAAAIAGVNAVPESLRGTSLETEGKRRHDASAVEQADAQRDIVLDQERGRVVQQIQTPLEQYAQKQQTLTDLFRQGRLSTEEYARALGLYSLDSDKAAEASAVVAARVQLINRAYADGNVTLQRRNALLVQQVAAQGNIATQQRQGIISEAEGVGSFGSGATPAMELTTGLKAGAAEIVDTYGNAGKAISASLGQAFSSATDALTTFIETGKLDLAGLTQSILHDIIEITVRLLIARAIGGLLFGGGGGSAASLFPGGMFAGGSAGYAATSGVGIAGSLMHRGGIVGVDSASQRQVPAATFANAPRFHIGGTVGLMPGEVPIIAQAGERVLPAGSRGGGTVMVNQNITIDARGSSDPASLQRAARALGQQTKADTIDSLRRSPRGRRAIAAG